MQKTDERKSWNWGNEQDYTLMRKEMMQKAVYLGEHHQWLDRTRMSAHRYTDRYLFQDHLVLLEATYNPVDHQESPFRYFGFKTLSFGGEGREDQVLNNLERRFKEIEEQENKERDEMRVFAEALVSIMQ